MLIQTSTQATSRADISRQQLTDRIKQEASGSGPLDPAKQREADTFVRGLERYEGDTLAAIRTDASFKAIAAGHRADFWSAVHTGSVIATCGGAGTGALGMLAGAAEGVNLAAGIVAIGGFVGAMVGGQFASSNAADYRHAAHTALQLNRWEAVLTPDSPAALQA